MDMARNKSLRVPCDVPAVRLDVRLLSCCLASFALAQLFYVGLFGFTTEHPPQDIVEAGGVFCASAQLTNRDEVALF